MTSAKGNVKTISFDGQFVTISANRSLLGALSGGGELRFPIRAISVIEWSDAAVTKNGFIRINTGDAPLKGSIIRPAFMDAIQDSNSVVFKRGQSTQFGAVRNEIELAMAAAH